MRLTANEVGPLNGLGGSNPLVSALTFYISFPRCRLDIRENSTEQAEGPLLLGGLRGPSEPRFYIYLLLTHLLINYLPGLTGGTGFVGSAGLTGAAGFTGSGG